MSLESNSHLEKAPVELLKEWAGTLAENEVAEVDRQLRAFSLPNGKASPELLFLDKKGVSALQNILRLQANPADLFDGFDTLSGLERNQLIDNLRKESRQDLAESLETNSMMIKIVTFRN
jgi:hypothetical protein